MNSSSLSYQVMCLGETFVSNYGNWLILDLCFIRQLRWILMPLHSLVITDQKGKQIECIGFRLNCKAGFLVSDILSCFLDTQWL